MRRRTGLTVLLLTLAGTLAGCGSTVQVGRGGVLRLAVSEYHIAPASASAAPGRLTLLVRNFGRLEHNLAITAGGRTLASTQPLPPGSQAKLTVSLPRGSYELESTLDSDATLGATAALQVR
jgi:hypothetical protein